MRKFYNLNGVCNGIGSENHHRRGSVVVEVGMVLTLMEPDNPQGYVKENAKYLRACEIVCGLPYHSFNHWHAWYLCVSMYIVLVLYLQNLAQFLAPIKGIVNVFKGISEYINK